MSPPFSRPPRVPLLPLAALLFCGLALAAPSRAATLTVTSTADPTGTAGTITLRDAITAAQPGDTITFDPTVFAAGSQNVITLASALPTITQDVTITGPGAGTLAVDGAVTYRVFAITGGTVVISDLTIQNGTPPANDSLGGNGGGVYNGGTLTLSDCTLSGNSASFGGGGVNNAGTLTLTACTLSGNSAGIGGGGGVFNNGAVTLTDCTLSGNSAGGAGGGILNDGGTVTLTDDILYGDTGVEVTNASGSGGTATASYCDVGEALGTGTGGDGVTDGGSNLNADPTFVSGTSPYDLHLQTGSPCFRAGTNALAFDLDGNSYGSPPTIGAYEITGQTGQGYLVTNNNDSGAGSLRAAVAYANANAETTVTFAPSVTGTIMLTSGDLEVDQDATIVGPGAGVLAVDGGGASRVFTLVGGTPQSPIVLSGLTLQNGYDANDSDSGGGLNNQGYATVTACTLSGNVSVFGGGGVFNDGGVLTLTACTLSGNTATGANGGGIDNGGTLTLTGCVLSGNSATGGRGNTGFGGGVFSGGLLTMTSCTLSGNSAVSGGGFYNTGGNTATLTDDVLYGDTANGVVDEIVNSGTLTATYCDIQQAADTTFPGTSNLNVDPKFVSATDLHLQSTSPVIGQGTASAPDYSTTDHDGVSYASPPSLGAFEFVAQATLPISHVLWNNPDGHTIFWNLNSDGSFVIAGNYPAFQDDASGNTGYTAIALSTGTDGLSHMLWTNPDGHAYLWTVQTDGTHTDTLYGPFSDDGTQNTIWKPVAVSTGGDNLTHILWSNPDGRTILWDVAADGTFTVKGNYDPQTNPATGSPYVPVALASGPAGLSHILWNNADGTTLLWDLDSSEQTPTAYTYQVQEDDGTANTIWKARAISVGPDNVRHLLWNNPNGRTILWNVASDGTFTIPGNYGPFADDASGNSTYTAVALATGSDGVSHFAWDNPDGNTYLWSVNNLDGSPTAFFYPPFYDGSDVWQAVAVSAAPPIPGI